ncbi:MAG: ECF transporter S component [Clostridia bacterium]
MIKEKYLYKTVLAAMFAAIVCVSTIVIQIQTPLNGYVNAGDCFVLISAWMLGGYYGAAAAGIGSMLADLMTGYAHYAPGTLIIKAGMAVVAVLVFKFMSKCKINNLISYILSAVCAEVVMVAGYFGYAAIFRGKGLAAISSIPGNLVQAAFGIVLSVLLIQIIKRIKK